jgi:L-rhamnose isomerase
MSKKDYEMLAQALASVRARKWDSASVAIVDDVSRAIASELLNTNPQFDMRRFMDAAVRAPVVMFEIKGE